jgi:hypothetical protein
MITAANKGASDAQVDIRDQADPEQGVAHISRFLRDVGGTFMV